MKVIEKYVDELSGREFAKIEDAIKSEKKNGGIENMFKFWKPIPKGETCEFENGGWCYQRTKAEYDLFVETLIRAVKEYEPWIAKKYENHGGLSREHMKSGYMIGRYLDDGNSELYAQYCELSKICQVCFRQWGQPYYANNCTHEAKSKPFDYKK